MKFLLEILRSLINRTSSSKVEVLPNSSKELSGNSDKPLITSNKILDDLTRSKDTKEVPKMLISREEVLMGRDKEYPLDSKLESNLADLLVRLNKFREIYGKPMVVTSGYRPGSYNEKAGGAPNSSHVVCQACDFADRNRALTTYILTNPEILENTDLYMEDPAHTPTWVHLQSKPTSKRIFKP